MEALRVLQVREWSRTGPDDGGPGATLRGLVLTDGDRALLRELELRTSLRVHELRAGLLVEIGPHVGTVTLSCLRLVVLPKIRIGNLLRMVAYAFEMSDLALAASESAYTPGQHGFIDLLGLALLRAAERLARGGLLSSYLRVTDDIATPRGRIVMRHAATHPRTATLRCAFDELTTDHLLNQVLAAGLRLAARLMDNLDLRLELARAADRLFGVQARLQLDAETLRRAGERLDRRASHYRTAVMLIALLYQGSRFSEYVKPGELPLASFLLDMNTVFERFLERYLRAHAPDDLTVRGQDVRGDVFSYLENPSGWQRPTIRPDLVLTRRGVVVTIGDAKYKNRHENPPSTAELYQLTTYGLSYPMPEPREVLLFHPLAMGELDRPTQLLFAPGAAAQSVRIRLVGVPVDGMLAGQPWWPLA